MKTLRLAVLLILPTVSFAQKSDYPLTLEITSYMSVQNGAYTTPRQYWPIGGTVLSTGGMTVPISAMISEGTVTLAGEKIHCTLWNRKHYLLLGEFHARQIADDEIEVQVVEKKKTKFWKFKIIRASKG